MHVDDGDQSRWPTVQVPPPPPRRSPTAAVLLNLTGLALGYAYLRRRRRAALYLTGTVLLVVLAFATNAADLPWLWRVLAVLWLGWMAVDGWLLARWHPRPLSTRAHLVPVVVAVVLVGAMVAGFLFYGAVGRRVYADGVAAQARADCANAIMKYDTVTGPYELTLSRNVPAATTNREQCAAFAMAENAHARGAYIDAIRGHLDYRDAYPATVLVPFVHENLERTYRDRAGSLLAAGDYPGAIQGYQALIAETGTDPDAAQVRAEVAAAYFGKVDALRSDLADSTGALRVEQARGAVDLLLVIQRDFADTPTAPKVPQGIVDTFTTANARFAEGKWCAALPVLDYLVTLPDAETAGVVGVANADRVLSMLECGLANYRAPDYDAAITQMEALVAAYPDSPQAALGRSVIIAAEVAMENGAPIPIPAPLGGDSPGNIPVVFYNESSNEVRVLVAGPTAHEFTIPGCPDCPEFSEVPRTGCGPSDKPSVTLRLGPGDHHVLAVDADSRIKSLSDTINIRRGFEYRECLYNMRFS